MASQMKGPSASVGSADEVGTADVAVGVVVGVGAGVAVAVAVGAGVGVAGAVGDGVGLAVQATRSDATRAARRDAIAGHEHTSRVTFRS